MGDLNYPLLKVLGMFKLSDSADGVPLNQCNNEAFGQWRKLSHLFNKFFDTTSLSKLELWKHISTSLKRQKNQKLKDMATKEILNIIFDGD